SSMLRCMSPLLAQSGHAEKRNRCRYWGQSGHGFLRRKCLLLTDTVEKVVSDPPKRNNRIRTASYLNRNCVRGRDFESMLRIRGRKIVFQQYRPKADIVSST